MLGVARLLATVLVLAATVGCEDTGQPAPAGPDTTSSIAAFPEAPHVDGPIAVRVRPALEVVSDDGCTATATTLCSVDGQDSWVPLGIGHAATLAAAMTHLSADHTSWTTVLRFDAASGPAVEAVASRSGAAGGYLLVVRHGVVLAAVRPDAVAHGEVRLEGLAKPDAWAVVEAFDHQDR